MWISEKKSGSSTLKWTSQFSEIFYKAMSGVFRSLTKIYDVTLR